MPSINIDYESCCGVGYCAQVAPEVFEVVDDKVALRDAADLDKVDPKTLSRAAKACPWRVITIADGE